MNKIGFVKRIEKENYPPAFRQMQHCRTIRDLAEYAEVPLENINIITGSDYYLIVAGDSNHAEVVDLAGKLALVDIYKVKAELAKYRELEFDARESTSYRLLRSLKGWNVASDIPWNWDGEVFHSILMRNNNQKH